LAIAEIGFNEQLGLYINRFTWCMAEKKFKITITIKVGNCPKIAINKIRLDLTSHNVKNHRVPTLAILEIMDVDCQLNSAITV
jgi:hypothetical protein